MRKLFGSRRAVSPVVSAVLMILVVMIGMSLLFAFFVNYARDFQTGSGSAVLESMVIEDVWFIGSTANANVTVYNVGKVDFNITSVYIDDKLAVSLNLEIKTEQHEMVTVPWDFEHGHSYSFKIVTTRGTAFEGEYWWQ